MNGSERDADPSSPTPLPDPAAVTFPDRRRAPRFKPVIENAFLGWWEGDSFCAEQGALRNVSEGGAAIELEHLPPNVETVWLCVAGPGRVTWAPARLSGHEGRVARLAFTEPFPDELFELLVWGFDTADPAAR